MPNTGSTSILGLAGREEADLLEWLSCFFLQGPPGGLGRDADRYPIFSVSFDASASSEGSAATIIGGKRVVLESVSSCGDLSGEELAAGGSSDFSGADLSHFPVVFRLSGC